MWPSEGRRPTVIFLHIPKAAGTTLHNVLERVYPSGAVFDIPGPMSEREMKFANLTPAEHARIRLVKGHVLFGVHRHIPHPYTYVTLLRHPVERVISHYYFVKRTPHHRLHKNIVSTNMSLEEYVLGGTALELDNGQVRALFGYKHLDVPYGDCSDEMLSSAIRNLQTEFSVVGIAERFDETLLLMAHHLKWNKRPLYVRRNVTKNRPALHGVPDSIIQRIEAANALDLKLYRTVVQGFDEDVNRYGIPQRMEKFLQWNNVYGRFAGPLADVHSQLSHIKNRRIQSANV